MQTVTIQHSNGSTTYKINPESGTAYYAETKQAVINAFERLMKTRSRVRIYYGDETGRDWAEEHDVRGVIGRSCGEIKVPILIATTRSFGGGAILCDRIVKIKNLTNGTIEYQQDNYKAPTIEIAASDIEGYAFNTIVNGTLYGRHKTERSAILLKKKLS